jgi:hypothetical protein
MGKMVVVVVVVVAAVINPCFTCKLNYTFSSERFSLPTTYAACNASLFKIIARI